MRVTCLRLFATCVFALLAVLLVVALLPSKAHSEEPHGESLVSDRDEADRGPQYPVRGEIVAQVREDGRIELCFRPESGELVCPRLRVLNPETASRDRWISSSEISWSVPIDPDQVIYSPTLVQEEVGFAGDCTPDFERMMEATWKVETTRARGSGFHIGNGRFVTAHHVIDDAPPFVALTHGDRAVAAQVLGSSPEHDVALLEVFDPGQVDDLPTLDFHNPERSDVGNPVFLVGYPSAGALTVATGVLTRVWEDEILTSSSSFGGNSGGPMFDACGNVIGVLWAGSSSRNFSHSGEALRSVLGELGGRSGRPPIHVPEIALPEGLVIWHYGPQPPEGVDCVRVDGAWWVGLAGAGALDVNWGVDSRGSCTSGHVRVLGLERRPQPQPTPGSNRAPDNEYDEGPCPGDYGAIDQKVETVLHKSNNEFGEVTLGRLRQFEWCDVQATYRLEVSFLSPLNHRLFSADLIGIGGRVNRGFGSWPGRGWYTRDGFVTGFWQDFAASPGFEPTAFQVTVNREEYRVEIEAPAVPTPHDDVNHIEQRARIAVWIDSESNEVVACLRVVGSELSCPTDKQVPLNFRTTGWQRLNAHEWLTDLALEDALRKAHCSPTVELGEQAWQMTALSGDGSAVYVGGNQFITADRLFSNETPWGVVSQGTRALPVARVASDARNGLALVEVIGTGHASLPLTSIARFASSTELAENTRPFLVAYPWGDADRFAMTRLRIREVTDRLLEHDGWGWDRAGAPIVDPCSREVLGLSTGRSEALRAETAVTVLRDLRQDREVPQLPSHGPELHGSIALLQDPVYLRTEQPDFGGWICNVRPSERYDVIYAVYLVSDSSPNVMAVADGRGVPISSCGWSGKVFIIEYRSDEVPQLLCAEPRSPRSPRTTIDVALSLPQGVELVQAIEFVRRPCPGLRANAESWASTHYVRLRFTGDVDYTEVAVKLVDVNDREHSGGHAINDIDPDVKAWRFNLGEAKASRLLVAGDGSAAAGTSATADDDSDSATPCTQNRGSDGNGLVAETLHRSQISVGEVTFVRYGAPIRCPWRHTHGVVLEFTEQVSRDTSWHAALISTDGQVLEGHWAGYSYGTDPEDEFYTSYRHAFEVPEDFEVIAAEIWLGSRRWIVSVGDS